MAIIKIDGKDVQVPDGLSDSELDQIAQDMAKPPALPGMKDKLMAAAETIMPQATEWAKGIQQFAEDPKAQATAIRYGLPMAAGVATGGAGVLPAMGMAGLAGAGGEGYAQLRERAAGLPAPETAGEAAKDMGIAGVLTAAGEGVGRGLFALGTKAFAGLKGLLAKANVPKNAPADAAETILKNPEITKPGYFKKQVDEFTNTILQGWKKTKSAAHELSKETEKMGNRIVIKPLELRSALPEQLKNLPQTTLENQAAMKELEPLFSSINTAAETAKTGVKLSEAKAVQEQMTAFVNKHLNGPDPVLRDLANRVRSARDTIVSTMEQTKGVGPKLATARMAHAENYKRGAEIRKVIGLPDDADPTDASTKLKAVSWLKNAVKTGDKEVLAALDTIAPGASQMAKQLAAVSSDQFSEFARIIPSLGVGSAGYMLHNQGAGAKTLSVLAVIGILSSPRVAGAVLRSSAPAVTKPAVVAATRALLPGLKPKKENEEKK